VCSSDLELVPTDDPDALARTLERVLHDADLRARLGAEARQTYERYLGSSRYGSDVVELFEQVLGRAALSAAPPQTRS